MAAIEAIMRDLSEDCYYAGWESGIEKDLWNKCRDDRPSGYGQCSAAEIADRLAALRALSEMAGGWLVYDDDERGPVPIGLAEWRRLVGTE